jgi:hypothetical protein
VIDNGASFYFHHNWETWESHLSRTFPFIKDHVLLQQATALPEAAKEIQNLITPEKIIEIVSKIPVDWLISESDVLNADEKRAAYTQFITTKLSMIDILVKEAEDAR